MDTPNTDYIFRIPAAWYPHLTGFAVYVEDGPFHNIVDILHFVLRDGQPVCTAARPLSQEVKP